jgi:hypothetical protein
MLPMEGGEEFVKIIKVENGTLDHLTEVLLEATLGFTPCGVTQQWLARQSTPRTRCGQ